MIPDDFFAHPSPLYPRALRDRVYAAWRNAQRFEFSTEASAIAGRLAFEAPELVINHRQFAIPPYPTTYIEMDSRAFFDAGSSFFQAALKTGVETLRESVPDLSRDTRIGYLIDGTGVYGFSETPTKRNEFALTPFMYWTVPPGQEVPVIGRPTVGFGSQDVFHLDKYGRKIIDENSPVHRRGKLALLIGSAMNTTAAQLVQDDILRANEIEPLMPMDGTDMKGWYGDMRNLWVLLLWLNQPARCQFIDAPPARRISRGKLRTYSAYRTVEIELGRVRNIRRAYLLGAPHTPPRDHLVRGAFHHHGGLTQGCGHDWPMEPDVDGIWQCRRCGRKRWWVKSHRRGDVARGTVVHDYDVTTPEMVRPPVGPDIEKEATG